MEIRFDTPVNTQSATRTGETQVAVTLGQPAEGITRNGAMAGTLITGVAAEGNTLRLQLRDSAFGYVLSKPDANRLRVDVFSDPLGTRWKPSGAGTASTPEPGVTGGTGKQGMPNGTAASTASSTVPSSRQPGTQNGFPATSASANATAPKASQTPPPNPAVSDARTLGSPTRPDGRGLVVLPQQNGQGGKAASNGAKNGTGTPQGNGTMPGNATRNVAGNSTGNGGISSAQAAQPDSVSLPSAEELSRLTRRIDQLPLNAMGGEQLRVPFAPLGAPAVEANATQARDSTSPVASSAPPPVSSSGPVGSTTFTETPLNAQGEAGTEGVTGKINLQGLAGGLALPASSTPAVSSAATPAPSAVADSVSPPVQAVPSLPTPQEPQPEEEVAPNLRGRLNTHGPEAWPQERGLDSAPVVSQTETAPVAEVPPESVAVTPPSPPPVIYVDEQGNEVPKPPDSTAMIEEAQKLLGTMQYQSAKDLLEQIKTHVLTPEQREQALYLLSDAYYGMYSGKWLDGFEPLSASTNEAMNFNLKSARVPDALFRLGMLNLNVGNQQDAMGYFGALRTKYPHDTNVALGFYRLGKHQLDNQQYAEAIRNFQLILDEYPENKVVRDAARYMAEALYKQGHYERALILVDFVDRRWPRIYLEDPTYLTMVGDLQHRMKRYPEALQTMWTYYNLLPKSPDNHKILLDIGTMYLQSNLFKGARDVFEELLRKFPDSPSAPTALLRMGEQTTNADNLTLPELFTLFERPGTAVPEVAYRRILSEYPDSPEARISALRLVAWQFWNKETADAMEAAAKFIKRYPESPLTLRADEIIKQGFERERAFALPEENYERLLQLWDAYPQVQAANAKLDNDLRVALARAQLNRGKEVEGMALLAPFLEGAKDEKYGEYVYNLALAKLLREEDWNGILNLGEKIASWPMPAPMRSQLDYSMAISAENLGLNEKSLPIWKNLSKRDDIPLYQKAYATYFMARDAERRKDLKDAYDLNLETLKLFTKLEDDRSDKADPERVRESIAALMDVTEVANRFAEALEWTEHYGAFVNEDSPDFAGLRFRQARLHRKMGDQVRWRGLLEGIVRREPESVFGRMAASELRTQEVARDLTRFAPQTP